MQIRSMGDTLMKPDADTPEAKATLNETQACFKDFNLQLQNINLLDWRCVADRLSLERLPSKTKAWLNEIDATPHLTPLNESRVGVLRDKVTSSAKQLIPDDDGLLPNALFDALFNQHVPARRFSNPAHKDYERQKNNVLKDKKRLARLICVSYEVFLLEQLQTKLGKNLTQEAAATLKEDYQSAKFRARLLASQAHFKGALLEGNANFLSLKDTDAFRALLPTSFQCAVNAEVSLHVESNEVKRIQRSLRYITLIQGVINAATLTSLSDDDRRTLDIIFDRTPPSNQTEFYTDHCKLVSAYFSALVAFIKRHDPAVAKHLDLITTFALPKTDALNPLGDITKKLDQILNTDLKTLNTDIRNFITDNSQTLQKIGFPTVLQGKLRQTRLTRAHLQACRDGLNFPIEPPHEGLDPTQGLIVTKGEQLNLLFPFLDAPKNRFLLPHLRELIVEASPGWAALCGNHLKPDILNTDCVIACAKHAATQYSDDPEAAETQSPDKKSKHHGEYGLTRANNFVRLLSDIEQIQDTSEKQTHLIALLCALSVRSNRFKKTKTSLYGVVAQALLSTDTSPLFHPSLMATASELMSAEKPKSPDEALIHILDCIKAYQPQTLKLSSQLWHQYRKALHDGSMQRSPLPKASPTDTAGSSDEDSLASTRTPDSSPRSEAGSAGEYSPARSQGEDLSPPTQGSFAGSQQMWRQPPTHKNEAPQAACKAVTP
jgi:hypothetical protein